MIKNISPLEWLSELSATLNAAEYRVSGKNVPAAMAMEEIQALLKKLRNRKGSLYWVGNGGSLAVCSHLAQDVLNKLKIRSIPLSDASMLTCMANDFGYANVFKKPLEILFTPGDMLIGISSSGNSESIVSAARLCLEKGGNLIALSAFSPDNSLRAVKADVSVYLPTTLYGLAEVGHEAVMHAAIESLCLAEMNTKVT